MDFAVGGPLVRRLRLVFGFCPSTHAFARCFLQTPPRGGSPCTLLALHLHQVGQKTFTSKLLSMPSTPPARCAGARTERPVVGREDSDSLMARSTRSTSVLLACNAWSRTARRPADHHPDTPSHNDRTGDAMAKLPWRKRQPVCFNVPEIFLLARNWFTLCHWIRINRSIAQKLSDALFLPRATIWNHTGQKH